MYSNGGIYIPDRKPPMGAMRNPYLKINRGIVGDWMMWEGAGQTVEDLSGNGNTGVFVFDAHFTPGKFGSSVDFDGSNDRIELSSIITLGSSATVVAWIKIEKEALCSVVGNTEQYDYPILLYDSLDRFYIGNGTTQQYWTYPDGTFNEWKQVVAVCDGTNAEAFINAVSLGSPQALTGSSSIVYIGDGHAYDFAGQIDHVLIYNRALIPAEIAQLFQEPFCGFRWASIEQLAVYYEAAVGVKPMWYYQEMMRRAG